MKWIVDGTTRKLNLAMRLGLGLAGLLWAVTAHAQGAVQDKLICPLPSGPGTIILEPWRCKAKVVDLYT